MNVLSNRLLILYAPFEKVQHTVILKFLLFKVINPANNNTMSQTLLKIVFSLRYFQFSNPV